jgi:hypothetical protein
MEINPNDPQYLQSLVQGLQQQRNTANDTIAHLAALNGWKDQKITELENSLKAAIQKVKDTIVPSTSDDTPPQA